MYESNEKLLNFNFNMHDLKYLLKYRLENIIIYMSAINIPYLNFSNKILLIFYFRTRRNDI